MNQENTAEQTTRARAAAMPLTTMGSLGVPEGAAMFRTARMNRRKTANRSTYRIQDHRERNCPRKGMRSATA